MELASLSPLVPPLSGAQQSAGPSIAQRPLTADSGAPTQTQDAVKAGTAGDAISDPTKNESTIGASDSGRGRLLDIRV